MTRNDVEQFFPLRSEGGETDDQIENSRIALEEVFPRVFFDHPWNDGCVQSLVSEEADGRINGTIGVIKRQMSFRGKQIAAAVSSDLYVEPQSRSKMVGIQLLKSFLDGPQDLSIADVANEDTRKIWEQMGGIVAPLYGLNWVRIFRPAQFALSFLKNQKLLRPAVYVATPFGKLIDRLSAQFCIPDSTSMKSGMISKELTPESFAEHFETLAATDSLRPIYDENSLEWVWSRLNFVARNVGPSRQVLVEDKKGNVLGWYIYQVKPGRIGRVAQIVAAPKTYGRVLSHLFEDALQQGAVGLMGRLQPSSLQTFLDQGCLLLRRESFTLVHSRDRELMHTFEQGDAFLSLLEGEACLDIWNEPKQAVSAFGDVEPSELQEERVESKEEQLQLAGC